MLGAIAFLSTGGEDMADCDRDVLKTEGDAAEDDRCGEPERGGEELDGIDPAGDLDSEVADDSDDACFRDPPRLGISNQRRFTPA